MSIMVSIICNAYNHEKYIRKALDGFVNQKTDFDFEVIIHDDASTDRTADIIREYQKRYPKLIKAILENENQYSKGIDITRQIDLPLANGKYIALCEGDDYWIDCKKLQKQFKYMEEHPQCSLCIHNGILVNECGEKIGEKITTNVAREFQCEEVIDGGGGFCLTNSIFTRSIIVKKVSEMMEYGLDYFWQCYLASEGSIFCFCDKMSAYRVFSNGSWTSRIKTNVNMRFKYIEKSEKALATFNRQTGFKYDKIVQSKLDRYKFSTLILKREFKSLNKEPYKRIKKSYSIKRKIKFFIYKYFPAIFKETGWSLDFI